MGVLLAHRKALHELVKEQGYANHIYMLNTKDTINLLKSLGFTKLSYGDYVDSNDDSFRYLHVYWTGVYKPYPEKDGNITRFVDFRKLFTDVLSLQSLYSTI